MMGHCCLVHDADYRQSQKDWSSFVESLTEKVIEKDETIPELPPKDLVSAPDIVGWLSHCLILSSPTYRLFEYIGMSDLAQIQPLTRLAVCFAIPF